MGKRKFYVVWVGREPGIYEEWSDCHEQINGFPGARYKAFDSQTAATIAFRGDPDDQASIIEAIAAHRAEITKVESRSNLFDIPEINLDAIAVDGACSGVPGPMEYRGVDLSTGRELFHFGPIGSATNNIGEFLAIVHALAMLEKEGRSGVTVYSDSRTAQAWVRDRHARTQIKPSAANAAVRDLIRRAETWLQTHTPRNPVVKWPTEEWGEIPADFGRK